MSFSLPRKALVPKKKGNVAITRVTDSVVGSSLSPGRERALSPKKDLRPFPLRKGVVSVYKLAGGGVEKEIHYRDGRKKEKKQVEDPG